MSFNKENQLRGTLLWAAVLIILIFNTWFIYFNFQNVTDQQWWVSHTHEVISELDMVLSASKDSETGVRGYLLTHNEEYLEPYKKGAVQTKERMERVKRLMADNSNQQISSEVLQKLLEKRFDLLENLLLIFKKNGKIDPKALQFSEGKDVMDNLRAQVDKMKTTERALLASRMEIAERSKSIFIYMLWITLIVSVIAISYSYYKVFQNQRRLSFEAAERGIVAEAAKLSVAESSLENVGKKSLEFVSGIFGVLAGRLFMFEQNRLKPVAAYGVDHRHSHGDEASNLVGMALTRQDLWEITSVPANYWQVSSSLGSAIPTTLTFLPISFQGVKLGVFELASFSNFTEEQKIILKKLAETFGAGLGAAQSKEHLQALLERTQQQAEELEAQQEELKTGNEELEQQARALESQQQALNLKNKELEGTQLQLETKAADLERSNQYKSEFLAKMSHELRTPLNGLLILSTLLIENKEKNLTDQQKEFVRSINSAGNDLLVLINDILDLSKIEAKKLTLRAEEFTLDSLFQSKHRNFESQASAKNLQFLNPLSAELKTMHLHTDRQRLEQILRNFLSNALKFTERGSVTLSAQTDSSGKLITFKVTDTGVGIPKEKQDLIFEAFEQADSSISRKYGGTGLGLTISKELAALLGGEITVQSEEGKGSVFSLTIPIRLDVSQVPNRVVSESLTVPKYSLPDKSVREETMGDSDAKSAAKQSLQNVDFTRKTIMVVEDDEKFRSSVVEAVRGYDFSPIEIADGEVALEVLKQHTPSAILLDIKLPGISGLGILEMIKQLPHLRHIPVHMISALEYQHNALRMGALGYLTKPVTLEKVKSALGRIENLLSKKVRRVLLIEDDERQSRAVAELISGTDIEVVQAKSGKAAVEELKNNGVDCIILDLTLPDVSGFDLLAELTSLDISLPPIVIYTGKDLSDEEESYLRRYSESIIIKGARSPERLFDEVNLFLHRVESLLPNEKRQMLLQLRSQEKSFEGKTVLVVDDDIRNIFAMTSALESKGLKVKTARNGQECLDALENFPDIDLVIMDIMMPKMDGFEAMRRIRKNHNPRINSIPIVALTAKAMKEDHEKSMEAGASDYLPKPVNLDNLTTVLRVWLAPKGFLG